MSIQYVYPSQNPVHDQRALPPVAASEGSDVFNAIGLSFKDIIDVVNPLQQLPVVGTIYRAASGDTLSALSGIAGGALFGGPVGLIAGLVNAGIEAVTGNDIGGHLFAMLDGGPSASDISTGLSAYSKAQKLG